MKTIAESLEHLKGTEVKISDFQFLSTIGGGASSEVIQALHVKTGIICAVKKFKSAEMEGSEAKTFCREAKIIAKCRNFFLLPFYGVSFHSPYIIVMKFIKQGNLRDALHHKQGTLQLTPSNKTIIAFCIASGMQYLHDHGVVHRDLKTLNILLDGKLLPHICDFGLSRIQTETSGIMTQKIGTPSWMAPELFLSSDYTNKVDVYAFGILLWEMLTEEIPFYKMNAAQLAVSVCQRGERPPIPKDCPDKLKNLIQSCWNQDPERRPRFSDVMSTIRNGKVWYPGTIEDEIDSFYEIFDSDYFAKKGKQSSPFLKLNPKAIKSNKVPKVYNSKMKKASSMISKHQPSKKKIKQNGEEEDLIDDGNIDIPEFHISEIDVPYATARKKAPQRKGSNISFDFDYMPEAVPEPVTFSEAPVSFKNTEEPEYDPSSKLKIHQSQVHGSHFMPPAFISTFHAKIEESSDDGEEEEETEKRGQPEKPKPQHRNSMQGITPPSISSFELSEFDDPNNQCELGMLPPIPDYSQGPSLESTIKPVPLMFTTVSGDRPKPSEIPKSPFETLLLPENPLPDPLAYQYEVKPIPQPTIFVEPKAPEIDENGKKKNIFLEMETPESRGRTIFGRTNADVLLDYHRPSFENTFLRTMWQLTRFNARDFFSVISVLFTPPVPLYISHMALRHSLKCLELNQNAWRPFSRSDAATSLPFATPCLFDLSARIFLYVIPMNPDVMTPKITKQLLAMASRKVHQVLRIFSVYVANIRFIPDPYPVLNALLDASLHIMINGGTIGLIRILYHLCTHNEVFRQKKQEKCGQIFAHALYTTDFESAAVAFSAICGISDNPIELPNNLLGFHLKYPDIRPYAISYLAMRGNIPIDAKIIDGILNAAKNLEVAALLLCKVAESPEGAKILLKNTSWMDDGYLALDDASRIFAMIFKFPEFRSFLADSTYFETFLNRLVTSSQNRFIAAAAFIVAKIPLTFALVERFKSHSFLSRFFTMATISNEPTILKGCLLAVKKICDVEYCEEMSHIIENWGIFITAEGEYVDDALELAVKLTDFPEGINEFKKLDVPSILERTYVCERSVPNRDTLISRISA